MNWRTPLVAIGLLLFSAVPSRADIILVPYLGQSWSGIINDAGGGYPTTYGVRAGMAHGASSDWGWTSPALRTSCASRGGTARSRR